MKTKHLLLILIVSSLIITIIVYHAVLPGIGLLTDSKTYLHYDYVDINASPGSEDILNQLKNRRIVAFVYRGEELVSTIGYKKFIYLAYDSKNKTWRGRWPVPWNAEEGEYKVKLRYLPISGKKQFRVSECAFKIRSRKPAKLNPPVSILTLEYSKPFNKMKIRDMNGKPGGWRNIFKWADFMGVDTFFHLTGQTSAYKEKLGPSFPWNTDNLPLLEEIAAEAHKNGLKFGAWLAAYLTFGPRRFAADYEYSWDYDTEKGRLIKGRGISLADEKRVSDIIRFIKNIKSIPGIDYIGLDYIRNARGGFEMVDEFMSEMRIEEPGDWNNFTREKRMAWLGKLVYVRKKKDMPVVDAWNWWRARKVSLIVKEIKEKSGLELPLWAFTLSWQKGWQHGQDVIMMTDAGVDFLSVMMYECDSEQFKNMMKSWNDYLHAGDAQVVIGNQVDWVVHQNTLNPAGTEEYYNRLITAFKKVYNDRRAYGIFIHDFSRILWGRKGPYSSMEWLVAGASAMSRAREEYGRAPLKISLEANDVVPFDRVFDVKVNLQLTGKDRALSGLEIRPLPMEGMELYSLPVINIDPFEAQRPVVYSMKINKLVPEKGLRYMAAAKVSWKEGSGDSSVKTSFVFKYIDIKDYPLLPTTTEQTGIEADKEYNKKSMD